MGAEADERRAGSDRHARRRATPHDRAAPLNRRLVGMHLCPNGRVQSVRADQQGAVQLHARAVASPDQRGDAAPVVMVAIAGDLHARSDGVDAETFHHRPVQEHLQAPAVNGVLRPLVTCEEATGFGVDVVTVQPDQRKLLGLHTDRGEALGADPELVELPHSVGLQVDAHAEWPEVRHRLQHQARHANLVQGEGDAQAPDPTAGDENRQIPGRPLSSSDHSAGGGYFQFFRFTVHAVSLQRPQGSPLKVFAASASPFSRQFSQSMATLPMAPPPGCRHVPP